MTKFLVALFLVLSSSSARALDVMPDIDVLIPPTKEFNDSQTAAAVQNSTRAFFIQSGFKLQYDEIRKGANGEGERDKNITSRFIDEHTYLSHDEVFGVAALTVMVVKKTASTSFADPFLHDIKHYITIGQTSYSTGIRWSF